MTAGNDGGLVIANCGQRASLEEFSITVDGRYLRVKNREFALSNRTIVIWTSKSGGFRENREGWQPWIGAMYAVHLRLTGKLIGDFLLVIIELFSLGAFVLSQYTHL